MYLRLIPLLIIALSVCFVTAQQNEAEQQQHTVQLTREMVDALLQVLSPTCRVEMEGALGSQMEISDECKYEIQRTLAAFQTNGGQGVGAVDQEEPAQDQQQPRREAPSTKPSTNGGVSPAVYVFGFVGVAVALVAGLVVYVNKQRQGLPAVKPKKLSKKKVRSQAPIYIGKPDVCRVTFAVFTAGREDEAERSAVETRRNLVKVNQRHNHNAPVSVWSRGTDGLTSHTSYDHVKG